MKTILRKTIAVLLIGGVMVFGFSGCFGKKYNVDYNGSKASFVGAKDSYRAGARVTLYYNVIATDTDYSFYLDDEGLSPDYSEEKGYIIRFTMPEHDASVRVESSNSMEYIPEPKGKAVLTFHSFDGGGPSYTVNIEDASVAGYEQQSVYSDSRHDKMTGSAFTVYISFFGRKAGTTTAAIECRSPIADNYDAVYDITVNERLEVTVTERERNEIPIP